MVLHMIMCAGVAANYSQYDMGFKPSNIDQLQTDEAALANFTQVAANKTAVFLGLPSSDVVVKSATFQAEGSLRHKGRRALEERDVAAVSGDLGFDKGQGLLWFSQVASHMQLEADALKVRPATLQTSVNRRTEEGF